MCDVQQGRQGTARANNLPCDRCNEQFPREDLRNLDDHRLCAVCWQTRHTELLREKLQAQAEFQQRQTRQKRQRHARRAWIIVGLEVLILVPLLSNMLGSRKASRPATRPAGVASTTVNTVAGDNSQSDVPVDAGAPLPATTDSAP